MAKNEPRINKQKQIKLVNAAVIQDAILIANTLVGTKEETQNRGKVIDEIQRELGFISLPYCVIFVLSCYKRACKALSVPFPMIVTASSQTLFEWAKKQEFTYTDPMLIKPGDIAIWRKWNLWSGHAGLITSFLEYNHNGQKLFSTIEGNTSNNNYGSQSDGDGIYRRIRYANKIDFDVDGFYLRGFLNLRKILESV